MGKKTKSREAQQRAAEAGIAALLRVPAKIRAGREFINTFAEFTPAYRDKIEAFRARALRAPEDWRCRVRSRSPEKRFLELVRFTFARFAVPPHLESNWIDEAHAFADGVCAHGADQNAGWSHSLRAWYIIAAQGGSLYREGTRGCMTKLETHHFLTAPEEVTSSRQAFWYAFARAQTESAQAALRISRSKLAAFPIEGDFWTDAARFFARNPTSVLEMNDLVDFFQAAREEDESFSLGNRSLAVLRRRMEEWHRTLQRRQLVTGGSWAGAPIPDARYEAGTQDKPAIWRFKQIKTGNELFREGQRMHHCVVTYKSSCMSGATSIWSLTCEYPLGEINRGVTVEVTSAGAIVQCRGFANRRPYANEIAMLKRWAAEYGLTWLADES